MGHPGEIGFRAFLGAAVGCMRFTDSPLASSPRSSVVRWEGAREVIGDPGQEPSEPCRNCLRLSAEELVMDARWSWEGGRRERAEPRAATHCDDLGMCGRQTQDREGRKPVFAGPTGFWALESKAFLHPAHLDGSPGRRQGIPHGVPLSLQLGWMRCQGLDSQVQSPWEPSADRTQVAMETCLNPKKVLVGRGMGRKMGWGNHLQPCHSSLAQAGASGTWTTHSVLQQAYHPFLSAPNLLSHIRDPALQSPILISF